MDAKEGCDFLDGETLANSLYSEMAAAFQFLGRTKRSHRT